MTTIKNSVAIVLAGVFAFGSFSATKIMGADWPCFRGPNHNGISTEAISWPKGDPKQVWKINVGIGHSAVSWSVIVPIPWATPMIPTPSSLST